MAQILTYVLVDEDGREDEYEYDSLHEAKMAVQPGTPTAIIERVYEYDDSSLVWTPNGEDTWP